MKQKFELSLTNTYASQWGLQEALREMLQNAIDQEKQYDNNKMSIDYDGNNILRICNNSSILHKKTLLLGYTSKSDDDDTIGQFGEGYKIALLVLTRLGHKVTIYNYGKQEVWTAKLVKSRRYEGELILTIYVETEYKWKKTPNNNLTIEIEGIKATDYQELVRRSLWLQSSYKDNMLECERGNILLDEKFKSNIYVNGLYVTNIKELEYGYDIKPKYLTIGRDRDLVSDYDIFNTTSDMWRNQNNFRLKELIKKHSQDVSYLVKDWTCQGELNEIGNDVYSTFKDEHGENAIPVVSQEDVERVKRSYVDAQPIIVNYLEKKVMDKSEDFTMALNSLEKADITVEQMYEDWKEKHMWTMLKEDNLKELDKIFNKAYA